MNYYDNLLATLSEIRRTPVRRTMHALELRTQRHEYRLLRRYLSTVRCDTCGDYCDGDYAEAVGTDAQELEAVVGYCVDAHRVAAEIRDERIQAGFDRGAK